MPMDVTLLEFGDGHAARVARPCQFADVASAVAGLGLRGRRPVLVVVGGAAGLDEADKKRLFTLFGHALLPIVASRQAVVVDGGTDSGVMQLLGRAKAEAEASFPLVDVAAEKKVILPGDGAEPGDRAPLERNHSHFVLVPGSSWGDESPWLSWVATEIAGSAPSATVLINGGEIAFQDVAHSPGAHRPVLAIAGTGRTADRIAAAVDGDHTDEQATQLAGSPLVTAGSWAEGPAAVRAALEELTRPEVYAPDRSRSSCMAAGCCPAAEARAVGHGSLRPERTDSRRRRPGQHRPGHPLHSPRPVCLP
jgi:SLOG in TRPM, prokaryote